MSVTFIDIEIELFQARDSGLSQTNQDWAEETKFLRTTTSFGFFRAQKYMQIFARFEQIH